MASYTTKELSPSTWSDFEDLFSRGNGWDFCACMYFQRGHLPSKEFPNRAAMQVQNHPDKHDLVCDGRAHGILVYTDDRAVGWCQFGPTSELPLDGRVPLGPSDADWRITCFVTEKAVRGTGVAQHALHAALAAIAREGGGIVEAYPVATLDPSDPRTSELIEQKREWKRLRASLLRTRGRRDPATEEHFANEPSFEVDVAGVGSVIAWSRPGQELENCGTVSMFEREGFAAVSIRTRSTRRTRPTPDHVVMRKTVARA
jgi:GNAT superfamily N-acetyltransferase